ncbi:hypothetical protein ACE01N_08320 [Saccharicrinis sp. FJH2]|uniref:hypothetical protein n=1 Tax=Saccharicrinis sp. FJH65 TaxID=3344659 RepID=UPI0035F32C01
MKKIEILIICFIAILTSCKEDEYLPNLEIPSNFNVTKGEFTNKINISWNIVEEAKNYQIFRYDSLNKDYIMFKELSDNFFSDTTIKEPDRKFYYRVRVFNSDRSYSKFSEYDYGYIIKNYTATLSRPIEVIASKGDYVDRIKITWNSEPANNTFEIYKYNITTNNYIKIGETQNKYYEDFDCENFDDTFYKIRIYNSEKEFSEFSEVASGFKSPFDKEIHSFDLTVNNSTSSIILNWEKIKGAEKYYLYKSISDTLMFEIIDSTDTELLFEDSELQPGIDCFYKLKAYNKRVGYTNFSEIRNGYVYEKWQLIKSIGERGSEEGNFNFHYDIVVDKNDNIYVSDGGNERIQIFDKDGNFIKIFATLDEPRGMVWTKDSNLIVADTYKNMTLLNRKGEIIHKWLENSGTFNDADIDQNGNIYVSNINMNRVFKFDNNYNQVHSWGSKGVGDYLFTYPRGILCYNNKLLVSDDNVVKWYTSDCVFIKTWDFGFRVNYMIKEGEYIYMGTSNGIYKINAEGKILAKIGENQLSSNGIVIDNQGRLIAVNTSDRSILFFKRTF